MDERSIVTPSDLDAAIRSQQNRRWDALWADAQRVRLRGSDWVGLIFAGLMGMLIVTGTVIDADGRDKFRNALPLLCTLFTIGMVVLSVYVNHMSRQIRALRELLHGVLKETNGLLPTAHSEEKVVS